MSNNNDDEFGKLFAKKLLKKAEEEKVKQVAQTSPEVSPPEPVVPPTPEVVEAPQPEPVKAVAPEVTPQAQPEPVAPEAPQEAPVVPPEAPEAPPQPVQDVSVPPSAPQEEEGDTAINVGLPRFVRWGGYLFAVAVIGVISYTGLELMKSNGNEILAATKSVSGIHVFQDKEKKMNLHTPNEFASYAYSQCGYEDIKTALKRLEVPDAHKINAQNMNTFVTPQNVNLIFGNTKLDENHPNNFMQFISDKCKRFITNKDVTWESKLVVPTTMLSMPAPIASAPVVVPPIASVPVAVVPVVASTPVAVTPVTPAIEAPKPKPKPKPKAQAKQHIPDICLSCKAEEFYRN